MTNLHIHAYSYGHYDQCLSRPDLYNILLSRIPKERLKLGKRFVNFQQTIHPETGAEQVMVRCSDGTYYHADVLVGADGASSVVRQSLYRQMKDEGSLPKVDQEEHQYRHVSLIGVTNALSTRKHPDLKEKFSQFKVFVNKQSPYMVSFPKGFFFHRAPLVLMHMDSVVQKPKVLYLPSLLLVTLHNCTLVEISVGSCLSQGPDTLGLCLETWMYL